MEGTRAPKVEVVPRPLVADLPCVARAEELNGTQHHDIKEETSTTNLASSVTSMGTNQSIVKLHTGAIDATGVATILYLVQNKSSLRTTPLVWCILHHKHRYMLKMRVLKHNLKMMNFLIHFNSFKHLSQATISLLCSPLQLDGRICIMYPCISPFFRFWWPWESLLEFLRPAKWVVYHFEVTSTDVQN